MTSTKKPPRWRIECPSHRKIADGVQGISASGETALGRMVDVWFDGVRIPKLRHVSVDFPMDGVATIFLEALVTEVELEGDMGVVFDRVTMADLRGDAAPAARVRQRGGAGLLLFTDAETDERAAVSLVNVIGLDDCTAPPAPGRTRIRTYLPNGDRGTRYAIEPLDELWRRS